MNCSPHFLHDIGEPTSSGLLSREGATPQDAWLGGPGERGTQGEGVPDLCVSRNSLLGAAETGRISFQPNGEDHLRKQKFRFPADETPAASGEPQVNLSGPPLPLRGGRHGSSDSSIGATSENQVTVRRAARGPEGAQPSPRANRDTEPNKTPLAALARPGRGRGHRSGSSCSRRGC